jgi:hypothetical protein
MGSEEITKMSKFLIFLLLAQFSGSQYVSNRGFDF